MEAYDHNDTRIREWINQIVEKIFTVCLLTGVDSDAEFQKGCQIVTKLTSLLQETPTLPSEFLAGGVKHLLEQQLPDARVINSFPAFQATMDRMLRESLLKVTDTQKKESFNGLASYTDSTKEINIEPHDSYTERPMKVSTLEFVTHSLIPALTTVNIPYPDIQQAQAKSDAILLSDALAKVVALTQAEKQAKFDALALTDALDLADAKAKSDAISLSGALAKVVALTQAGKRAQADALVLTVALDKAATQAESDAISLSDALAKVDALTEAEKQAKADALTFAEALAQAEAKFEAVAELDLDALIKFPAIVTSVHSKASPVFHPSQDPKQTNLLKRVLSNIFPKGTVYWNKSLKGQIFLAQVEDILICLHDPENPCNLKKYHEDGWKVLVCSTEDLIFPRRLERGIRQIERSVLGRTCRATRF